MVSSFHFLKGLAELKADTSRRFRGLLGRFSSAQNELIYQILMDYDSDPWGGVLDHLRKANIGHTEDAWLLLRSTTITGSPSAFFLPLGFFRLAADLCNEWATRCFSDLSLSTYEPSVPISASSPTALEQSQVVDCTSSPSA